MARNRIRAFEEGFLALELPVQACFPDTGRRCFAVDDTTANNRARVQVRGYDLAQKFVYLLRLP
eukprot:766764-Hanusia_phi.AAC.12